MANWDKDSNQYVEDEFDADETEYQVRKREEKFRAQLLSELNWLADAIRGEVSTLAEIMRRHRD